MELMKELNVTNVIPQKNEVINSLDSLSETFAYFFTLGAAAEFFVDNE